MGMDLTAFKQEITRWRHHWSIGPPDDPLPETLVETLDQTNAAFYPGIYVAVKTTHYLPHFGVRCWAQFQLDKKNENFTPQYADGWVAFILDDLRQSC